MTELETVGRVKIALILVGGYGTRLRPLTLSFPKPLIEFANKPILLHQIEALAKAGVETIVLAVSYQADQLEANIKEAATSLKINVIFSYEHEPLGTGGPLALAREHLLVSGEPFYVLNSDIICKFPFHDLERFHRNHGQEGTIAVTKVADPTKYGVVLYNKEGRIDYFVEKPQEYVNNSINAGLYIFNPSILNRLEVKPISIVDETFPIMATEGKLFAYELPGFWMDIGQPEDYLKGTCLYLNDMRPEVPKWFRGTADIVGNVLIDPSVKIGKGCRIGPHVTIGENCFIGDGVSIKRCTILSGTEIKSNAWLNNSIIGWRCKIGRWSRVDGMTIFGEDVTLKDDLYVNGAHVLPHKVISKNIPNPTVIF